MTCGLMSSISVFKFSINLKYSSIFVQILLYTNHHRDVLPYWYHSTIVLLSTVARDIELRKFLQLVVRYSSFLENLKRTLLSTIIVFKSLQRVLVILSTRTTFSTISNRDQSFFSSYSRHIPFEMTLYGMTSNTNSNFIIYHKINSCSFFTILCAPLQSITRRPRSEYFCL